MSSFATFFRNLPETLQQPAALAMLGSAGVHLLLFATLPAFTSSTEPRPESEVRQVRLLAPSQGGNQTQASASRQLPPLPNTPNSKIQLPPTGQGTSPVPNPLYTIPELTPLPIPVPSQTQISSNDRFNELLRQIASRQQQPTTIRIPKPPEQPSPQPNQTTPNQTTPNQTTPNQTTPIEAADPRKVAQSVQSSPPVTPPSTPVVPSAPLPSPSTPPTANDQLMASLRYNPDGTLVPGETSYSQKSFQLASNYVQSATQRGIKIDWSRDYIRVRQLQDPELKKPIPERPYPLNFALNPYKQHPVSVAVYVGKDGRPVPNLKPDLIGTTGYQILNGKAIEIIQQEASQTEYPKITEGRIRVFVYEFQFKAPNTGTA